MQPLDIGKDATFEFAHAAPVEAGWIAVLLIAGYDAAFAADTLRHIEVEAVLFANAGRAGWHEQIVTAKQW